MGLTNASQIKWYFGFIGMNTGLKTREVDSDDEADVSIFQVPGDYFINQGEESTVGVTYLYDDYIDILFLQSDSQFDTNSTIAHEIAHSVGLRHPYGDGFHSDYTIEDTVMSYNDGYYGESVSSFLTDADQAALKEIWGENGTNYDLRVDPTALNEDLTVASLVDSDADKFKNAWRKDGIKIFLDTTGSSTSYFDGEYVEDALPFSAEEQSIALSIIKELDDMLDVEFTTVNNLAVADISIMIHDRSTKSGSKAASSKWDWDTPWFTEDEAGRKHYKYKYYDISLGDDQSEEFIEYIVRERLAIALGLNRPDNTPLLQSIMGDGKYNFTLPYNYTSLDKAALQSIWGVERGELGMNNLPAYNGRRVVLEDGRYNRRYELDIQDLVGDYTDADGDILWPEDVTVSTGTLAKHPSKDLYIFTPNPGFSGRVTVSYNIEDGFGGSIPAIQTFNINPNNLPAYNGRQIFLEDGHQDRIYELVTQDLIGDYSDADGDTLSAAAISVSTGSIAKHPSKNYAYNFTPSLGFNGRVTVNYNIEDGSGGSVPATKSFNIGPYDGIINGGIGKNRLLGTFGADDYLIKDFEKFTKKTADIILDFNSAEGDKISIARKRIPKFTDSEYTFKSVRGNKKVKKVARKDIDFIYDEKKGRLFFNSNGEGRGFGSKSSGGVLLVLSDRPKIEASDIVLVD